MEVLHKVLVRVFAGTSTVGQRFLSSHSKKLIKKVRYRLDLQINKRSCIVRQLRNDVAQLIQDGHYQIAFDRVDQIYKDECIVAVYELLDLFCGFISLHISYIRRNKDCPDDINEAISSIIFASARCGNLPELLQIRKLFSERYGERFERTALELLPGNLVNNQIRENLSIEYVPNEVKYKVIEEITASVEQNGPNGFHFDHPKRDSSMIDPYDNEPSSEKSTVNAAEEVIYVDDVAEFQSPLHGRKNGTDQRVFIFQTVHEIEFVTVEPSPPHVHPKLPEYDELAAMFTALKKEHLQNRK
ncbi:hypothetical protein OSB04_008637 [Centaurea solstitialis]|uniref:IST1-like protein n=1 Tax=Centaurea solstitialis TaxID=347529 RepID=A0AA38WJN7_9ASTR|nr:hypothetical protein OSB04_008637 [Centaurea solstitialis]